MLCHYGGKQTARVKETEREKRGYMQTVDTLTALNYRADYSGMMALDSSQADTGHCKNQTSQSE